MFWILLLVSSSILYLRKDLQNRLIVKLLVLYSFLERYTTDYITRLGIYLNPGLKIDRFLYHDYNRECITRLKSFKTRDDINIYVNKLMNGLVIIHYRWDNTPYVDVVSIDINKKYDIGSSLNIIRDNSRKGNKQNYCDLVSACSITVSNVASINDTVTSKNFIFNEEDITDFFLSIAHNSINKRLYVEDIWTMWYTSSNISNNIEFKDNYTIQVVIIDSNLNVIELNNNDAIQITTNDDNQMIIKHMIIPAGNEPKLF